MTDEQWAKADRIEGWLDKDEAGFLYSLCRGKWCEIGCYLGRSTIVLAQTGHEGYAVDWHQGSPEHPEGTDTFIEFLTNTLAYGDFEALAMRYEDAAKYVPSDLRFLFLDAEHSYRETRGAWDLYAPKVERGGIVALHDAAGGHWPEVERFANELRRNQDWYEIGTVNRTVAFQRR